MQGEPNYIIREKIHAGGKAGEARKDKPVHGKYSKLRKKL